MEIRGFVAGAGRKWHLPTETPRFTEYNGEWVVSAAVECEQGVHWQRWRDRPGKEGICRNCIRAIERREEARRQAQEAQQRSAEEIGAARKIRREAELGARINEIVPAEHIVVGLDGGEICLEQNGPWLRMATVPDDDGDAPLWDRRRCAELAFWIEEFAATGRLPTRAWLGDGEQDRRR